MLNFLILDSDARHRRRLSAGLTDRGHRVRATGLGAVGEVLSDLLRLTRPRPDVIVIDPYLPDMDAMLSLRMLAAASRRPLLILTAGRSEAELTAAVNAGADAWLAKPASAGLLEAHARAALRRNPAPPGPAVLRLGDLAIDIAARRVELRGTPITLTRAEFDLLSGLSEHPGRAVPRAVLLSRIRRGRPATANLVDVLLCRLRAKLGESAARSRYLHTVRGRGVCLRAPATRS